MSWSVVNSPSHRYLKLPVISLCSPKRHGEHTRSSLPEIGTSSPYVPNPRNITFLDLHTAEAPIELSPANMDLTMDQLCLKDCTINSVLNIYTVERKAFQDSAEESSGKDGIFGDSAAWVRAFRPLRRHLATHFSIIYVLYSEIYAHQLICFL